MHLALALVTVLFVWKKSAFKSWNEFHTTMMYFALGNLTYNFLTANHFLWKMKPDFLPNHSLTELVYTFIIFPSTSLLFLHNYPSETKSKVWHYLKWICLYVLVEWFFVTNGRMVYQHGWSLMWSAIFDITMFPMLRLHYKNPLAAYGISIVLCVFWVWMFDVPVNVPIEQRAQ